MNLRNRVHRLRGRAERVYPPHRISILICSRVGNDPEFQTPGLHFNKDGRVVTYVFEGAFPDDAVVNEIRANMDPHGKIICCYPDR